MENKINWWMIIGIVVVVAVITALVTMQVTGNVVKITPARVGTDIYTKAEIDSKLDSISQTFCFGTAKDLSVNTASGYTCKQNGTVYVQIKRGSNINYDLLGLKIDAYQGPSKRIGKPFFAGLSIVGNGSNNFVDGTIPNTNEEKVLSFYAPGADNVRISPIISIGGVNQATCLNFFGSGLPNC